MGDKNGKVICVRISVRFVLGKYASSSSSVIKPEMNASTFLVFFLI